MNIFKTVRQPLFSADNGGDDNHQESGKVTFSPEQQAEMDRIIGQRITSVRASMADYTDLKEMTDLIKGFGYEGATPAEIKAQLKLELDARNKQQELKDLENEAARSGSSPELLAEIKELKKEMAEIKQDKQQQQQAMENKQKADEAWNEQAQIFQEKYPDVNMPKLAENERFMKFLRNSTLPFVDAYEEYLDLVGGAEKAAIEKIKANDDRSTFSGKAKADPSGGTHGLTDAQQDLAKKNNMSFKEYADLYQQIPNK